MSYELLSVLDFQNFKGEYGEGIFTLTLTSWDDFHDVVKIFNNNTDYIWRGQDYDRSLKSSFYRKDNDKYKKEVGLDKIFNKLKQRLAYIINTDQLKDNEIWAIGQHYGLKTPLLDWTESPYIAAYFAFYKKNDGQTKINDDSNVAVYALNRITKRLMQKKKNAKKEVLLRERFVEFDLLNSNFDPRQNQRLRNQKGKFTKALNGDDIESVMKKFWNKKKNGYTNKIILLKIMIPSKYQDECLKSLRSMNITHGVLFPDYAGAVESCKNDLGLD